MAGIQEGLSDLLKQIIRSLCERCPPSTRRKGAFLSPDKGHPEESEGTDLALSPSLLHLAHTPLSYHIFP